MSGMDLTIHQTFLPHTDHEASLAFWRDLLGFEGRMDVEHGGLHWTTVGPPGQPDVALAIGAVTPACAGCACARQTCRFLPTLARSN